MGVTLLGFAAFVGLVAWGVRKASKAIGAKGNFQAPPYRHLDVRAGTTAEDVITVLRDYIVADGSGVRAKRAIEQLENAGRKRDALQATASARFTKSDISLDVVTSLMDSSNEAYQKMLANCVVLANEVQTFDAGDYHALKRKATPAMRQRTDALSQTQLQRFQEMESRLAEMDRGLNANETLLLDLDRYAANLNWLEREDTQGASAATAGYTPAVDEELRGYRGAQRAEGAGQGFRG